MNINTEEQRPSASNYAEPSPKVHYLDTNALRSLALRSELPILAASCKEGKISLCISNVALIEFVRQRYAGVAQESDHPTEGVLKERRVEYFERIYRQYRLWFQLYSVQIIDFQPAHSEGAKALFDEFRIDLNDTDGNDQRDALIIATFLATFTPAQAVLVCHETKLIKIARTKGYEVVDSAKNLATSLTEKGRSYALELPTPEDALEKTQDYKHGDDFLGLLRSIYPELNAIYAVGPSAAGEALLTNALENMGTLDKEIRIDILAHVQALAPVGKDDLFGMLSRKASKEAVQNNADRLCQERILQDTGNHWLPNQENQDARQICEQAMAHRLDDLIQLLDGR